MIDSSLDKAEEICNRDVAALKDHHIEGAEINIAQAQETYDGLLKDYGDKVTPGHPEVKAAAGSHRRHAEKETGAVHRGAAHQQAGRQAAAERSRFPISG